VEVLECEKVLAANFSVLFLELETVLHGSTLPKTALFVFQRCRSIIGERLFTGVI
jgi:hypothetical protein